MTCNFLNLSNAIRDNFGSLVMVCNASDGIEVRDASDDSVIASIWLPYFGKDYGVASKSITYKTTEFSNEFAEIAYQSVREYFFGEKAFKCKCGFETNSLEGLAWHKSECKTNKK